jgi:outer membrane protein assembly factor BamB
MMYNKSGGFIMRKRTVVAAVFGVLILALVLIWFFSAVPIGKFDLDSPGGTSYAGGRFGYDLPLDSESPWPKFRANGLQNGRIPLPSRADASIEPWEYRTGKGIFSSPVVDAQGNCYIGSADHFFYALDRNGGLLWRIETGEIIDSSALLDDRGRVYFGSGDARVYCADRRNGSVLWTAKAQTAQEVTEEFGVQTYNVNWFEGNVGILPNGDIIAPNDNYLIYRLDRENGEVRDRYLTNEMVWSLPAVNPQTGNFFFGSCFTTFNNILSYSLDTGAKRWGSGGLGFTAATAMLSSYEENGALVLGNYDGYLRCLTQRNGKTLWKRGLRDHIYASPGQLSDGTIIQPCADGSVYAVNPTDGSIRWVFDTLEPIRSSPAIGGDDLIYFGSGEGKLYCLNPDGTLRWSYQCILEGRNDLNSSPALGFTGIYIAGESGEIFFVPYDYPLREENRNNPRCRSSQDIPDSGSFLVYTSPLGGLYLDPPREIEANAAIVLSLLDRKDGNTRLGMINPKTVSADIPENANFELRTSADRRYLMLIPKEQWRTNGQSGGEQTLSLRVRGKYKIKPFRFGLKFFGGRGSLSFDQSFTFIVMSGAGGTAAPGLADNPFPVPALRAGGGISGPSASIELRRLSVPLPSLMPSFNQIGFDSLHYLAGSAAKLDDERTLFWVVGGALKDGETVIDPETTVRFPLIMEYRNGLATFYNYEGIKIKFVGSWDMPMAEYRVAAAYNPMETAFSPVPSFTVTANCDEIAFYGIGLKLIGVSDFKTGKLYTSGSLELVKRDDIVSPGETSGAASAAVEEGRVGISLEASRLRKGEHLYSLLVTAEDNSPCPFYYSKNTQALYTEEGLLSGVYLSLDKGEALPPAYKLWLMADTYPVCCVSVR